MKIISKFVMTIIFAGSVAASGIEAWQVVGVDSAGAVFTRNQTPSFIMRDLGQKYYPIAYEIRDWQGKVITEGTWRDSKLKIASCLPLGYYRLILKNPNITGDRSFAIVPELKERKNIRNEFFSLYSGAAIGGKNIDAHFRNADSSEMMCQLIELAGIHYVRDGFSWEGCNSAKNVFNYNTPQGRMGVIYQAHGIQCMNMTVRAPQWTKVVSSKLPDDLLALYKAFANFASSQKKYATEWEFWNEPDLTVNAPAPVWHYAACLKAAALGTSSGDPSAIFTNGGLSNMNGYYENILIQNGICNYIDAFNLHTYNSPSRYKWYVGWARRLLKEAGHEDMPIIFTETSTEAEGKTESIIEYCKIKNGIPQKLGRHSIRQEMLLAEFYPKSMLAFMKEGVARAYFFFFAPYNEREGSKDWGVMRRDGTVKPVYGAMSSMTWLLANARYIGNVYLGENFSGHLLKRYDGKDILVFWSNSPLDQNFEYLTVDKTESLCERELVIPGVSGDCILFDLFGKGENVSPISGTLHLMASRYPAYLIGKITIPVVEAGKPLPSVVRRKQSREIDSTIVFDAYLNNDDFGIMDQNTTAFLKKNEGRMELVVYNFSKEKKLGRVIVSGGNLIGIPENLELQPFEKKIIKCIYTPLENKFRTILKLHGVFKEKTTSSLAIPVISEQFLLNDCFSSLVKAEQPKFWRKNSSGKMDISVDTEENCIRFDTAFKQTQGKWAYPEYILQNGESLKGAYMISFEIRSQQDTIENRGGAGLYLASETKEQYFKIVPPTHTWEERRVYLSTPNFPLEEVCKIRIGGNPLGQKYTVWLRNVKIYRKK